MVEKRKNPEHDPHPKGPPSTGDHRAKQMQCDKCNAFARKDHAQANSNDVDLIATTSLRAHVTPTAIGDERVDAVSLLSPHRHPTKEMFIEA